MNALFMASSVSLGPYPRNASNGIFRGLHWTRLDDLARRTSLENGGLFRKGIDAAALFVAGFLTTTNFAKPGNTNTPFVFHSLYPIVTSVSMTVGWHLFGKWAAYERQKQIDLKVARHKEIAVTIALELATCE